LVAVTFPAPTIVSTDGALTAPLNVSEDAPDVVPMVLALASVTGPDSNAAPVPVSAPAPATPLPLMVIAHCRSRRC
jgi:hypothetical protein